MREIFLQHNNLDEIIAEAVKVLAAGGVIVYPTETAYGLGADYFSDVAVAKVYAIKQRAENKFLTAIVSDLAMAEKLVIFDDQARQLAAKYWPGALTMVLPCRFYGQKKYFPETLGLRISSNTFCQKLTRISQMPLVSTSANISGREALYSVDHIKEQFAHLDIQPDLLINAGNLPLTPPSTIIKIEAGAVEVLRQGKIIIN